ncbi:MAG TPA: M23 family metallopeptidase [Ignavibacteriaceae bacterium]|nr:M23 family metallopeptidase [Ignavibacteriaceae bacterium]
MKFNYFKSLEKLTLIIFPEGTNAEAKSFRLNGRRILIYLLVYTIVIGLLGFYLIYFTPMERFLIPSALKKTTLEEKQYEELSNKILILANEVEKLKLTNIRLRNAVQLGDTSLLKDINKTKETEKNKNIPAEGNILTAFNYLLNKLLNSTQVKDVYFIKPIQGFISRGFKPEQGHNGIDFVVKENTPVYAAAGGYVVFANYTVQYGYIIIINHDQGYLSRYKHCSLLIKKEGDFVNQGELIALSGNSGTETTGPHLHFEIWKDGKPVNPNKVLLNY